jgi:hypothetical protein
MFYKVPKNFIELQSFLCQLIERIRRSGNVIIKNILELKMEIICGLNFYYLLKWPKY